MGLGFAKKDISSFEKSISYRGKNRSMGRISYSPKKYPNLSVLYKSTQITLLLLLTVLVLICIHPKTFKNHYAVKGTFLFLVNKIGKRISEWHARDLVLEWCSSERQSMIGFFNFHMETINSFAHFLTNIKILF